MKGDGMLTRRGLTILELTTTIGCLSLLAAITAITLGVQNLDQHMNHSQDVRTRTKTVKDATYVKALHQAIVISGNSNRDMYLRPGLIDRLPTEIDGQMRDIPGAGEEDITANTTDNLYSMFIAQNYFTPEITISPVERNPVVKELEHYNYESYNPVDDQYWDDDFDANLETGSNTSYAHLVLTGKRMDNHWNKLDNPMEQFKERTLDGLYPVLGNRGPENGQRDWDSHTCNPHGFWAGNIVHNDNRVELLQQFTIDGVTYLDKETDTREPDNIFAMETGPGGDDAILSFTLAITEDDVELQHD